MKHIKPYNESKDKFNEDIAYVKMMLIDLADDGIELQVYGIDYNENRDWTKGGIIWIKLDCTKRAWSRSIAKGGVYMKWEDIDYKIEQVLAMMPNYELYDLWIKPVRSKSFILFDSIDEVIPTKYKAFGTSTTERIDTFDPKKSDICNIEVKLFKKK